MLRPILYESIPNRLIDGAVEVAAHVFGPLNRVACKVAVLPRQREIIELVRGDLVVRGIDSLAQTSHNPQI
jgi:hypothetical protein